MGKIQNIFVIFSKKVYKMEYDLLNIPDHGEQKRHKLKRTVQAPNSYFMNVKSDISNDKAGMAVVFSHSQTPIYCPSTDKVLAKVTGGKVMLADRCSFAVKKHDKKQT